MPEHPNEPILEAILVNQDKNSKDHIQMLEHLLVQADNNKLDPLLEAQLVITDKIGKDIVQAIKEIPKTDIPENKEVDLNETNKLLRELTDEVKKKEEYEIEIDSALREKLKGEKGDKGSDGINGKDGKDGKNGLNGIDGKDGQDGKEGPRGIPGNTLSKEDIEQIAKGLNKTKKQNLLFANSGVNSVVAGSNITIDNSNPQHPIISSTGGGSVSETFESVLRNLKSYNSTISYSGDLIDTIVYTLPSGTVTETVDRTGNIINSITLSGDTPSGIDLIKTFNYTGNKITSFTYS